MKVVSMLAAIAAADKLRNLPLSTEGSRIVDTDGNTVRLSCTNWYGAHMERYVVNGLDEQNIDVLSQMIADQGFNCVRLPYSLEQYFYNPVVNQDAILANPELFGLTAMEIFDRTVESLTNAGVGVVLNNHMSDAAWCCSNTDGNGLWHNKTYSANDWQDAVASISERYKDNLLVIGNDLRNEIRDDYKNRLYATWGDNVVKTDWKLAAT
jgi:endoglucanase